MTSLKNKCEQKSRTIEYFGNDWGIYIDTEKIDSNLPTDDEIIRQKYNIKFNSNDFSPEEEENEDDDEFNNNCGSVKIDICILCFATEDKNIRKGNFNKYFVKFIPPSIIICALTYIIIFAI